MNPSKPLIVNETKSSPETIVRFQIDETNEVTKEISKTRPTRKQAAESFVAHEIRSWSSFVGTSSTEKVFADKRSSRSYISETSSGETLQQITIDKSLLSKPKRSKRSGLTVIDRDKQKLHHHNKTTWHSIFGTMSDIGHILTCKRFRGRFLCLQSLIIFIDSCFRGIGQVMFANNPLSGLVSFKPHISFKRKKG
jgi:hypothetical protein